MEYCFRVMAGLAIKMANSIGAHVDAVSLVIPPHLRMLSDDASPRKSTPRSRGPAPPGPQLGTKHSSKKKRKTPMLSMIMLQQLWEEWQWDPYVIDMGEESAEEEEEEEEEEDEREDSDDAKHQLRRAKSARSTVSLFLFAATFFIFDANPAGLLTMM